MALDFSRVRTRETTLSRLVEDLGVADLEDATRASIATVEGLLEGITDADVVFVPADPDAFDADAADPEDVTLAWTLGHLVVHVTASAEESAALASELARGVPFHGRSRWEVPWQSVTTAAQCWKRLADSRRMRLASLQMWPALPPKDVDPDETVPTWLQARERFVRGLSHEDAHFEQIRRVVAEAKAARGARGA